MNTTTNIIRRIPMIAVVAITGAVTLWLVAEVAQPSVPASQSAAVHPSDGSFDRNEHRRHLALILNRDGFDVAESARFDRLEVSRSEPVTLTGFEKAEQARYLRLAPRC